MATDGLIPCLLDRRSDIGISSMVMGSGECGGAERGERRLAAHDIIDLCNEY